MAGVYLIAIHFRDAEAFSLPEDVFDFVEDRRTALGGTIFHAKSCSQLFEELALLARQFAGCNHAHVVEEIALSSAARVRQPFAFDTKDGAALRAFRNFQALLAGQGTITSVPSAACVTLMGIVQNRSEPRRSKKECSLTSRMT